MLYNSVNQPYVRIYVLPLGCRSRHKQRIFKHIHHRLHWQSRGYDCTSTAGDEGSIPGWGTNQESCLPRGMLLTPPKQK